MHIGMPLWTHDELAKGYGLPVACFYPHLSTRYSVDALREDPSQCETASTVPRRS